MSEKLLRYSDKVFVRGAWGGGIAGFLQICKTSTFLRVCRDTLLLFSRFTRNSSPSLRLTNTGRSTYISVPHMLARAIRPPSRQKWSRSRLVPQGFRAIALSSCSTRQTQRFVSPCGRLLVPPFSQIDELCQPSARETVRACLRTKGAHSSVSSFERNHAAKCAPLA